MNRWDEIQAVARNIASNVHDDPEAVNAMADDLIKLCGLMIGAVGKVVSGHGERQMNDASDWEFELDTEGVEYSDAEVAERQADFEAEQRAEATLGGTIYSAGEQIQDAAREAVEAASNRPPGARGRGQGVDLDRWRRTDPGTPCRCGQVPQVHVGGNPCNGEQFNGEPCKGGPCNGYVAAEPTGGWVYVDRRPAALRVAPAATPVAPSRSCCYTETGPCATCRNGGPVGGCCRPLWHVCPMHH